VKAFALIAVLAAACSNSAQPTPAPTGSGSATPTEKAAWTDEWLLAQGAGFLADTPDARRAALEAALTNPANMYSRIRLAAYGLGDRGWDLLPVWNPRSVPVGAAEAPALARGEIALPADRKPLWNGVTPTTMPEWIALGRRVFFEYPMRAEVFMEYALTEPALANDVGVQRTTAGDVPGLVVFANVDGQTRVGITCAICHSSVKDGALVAGQARRSFDYGKLRVTYDRVHQTLRSEEEATRMLAWGPGRADVTEDDDEDPVAIPDLWGLRDQRWLTQAGTIKHDSPLALAIRQETQLTDSNHALVRPPRELAWALTMYIYSLKPPAPTATPTPKGKALFDEHCARCHSNAAYGGNTVAAATIGTDPALATGKGRGTGKYRVPVLLDVRNGAPYLHHGAIASLDELLSPTRKEPGHTPGTKLSADDRAQLIAFLETL
jgi:mono/diheme cytochrome c family protein